MIQAVYRYRWLIYELVLRDVVLRYRGSMLGFVWTLLNPLLFMGIYTLVFGVYLRIDTPHYALFLVSGLLPWLWFLSAVQAGTVSIAHGRGFISQTVFPPIVLTLVPVLSNLVNYLLSIPILLIVLAASHVYVGWPILLIPVLVVIQFILTLGIVLVLSTFNVFFRDLQQLVTAALTLLFYVTPVIYPISAVPAALRTYTLIDPMAPVIVGYQDIFYRNTMPAWTSLAYAFLAGTCILYVGSTLYHRYKDAFADYV